MDWLVTSIVVSVVLTVVLNLALRIFPGAGDRAARKLDELTTSDDPRSGGVKVTVPWKAMLVASIVLTVLVTLVVNLALR